MVAPLMFETETAMVTAAPSGLYAGTRTSNRSLRLNTRDGRGRRVRRGRQRAELANRPGAHELRLEQDRPGAARDRHVDVLGAAYRARRRRRT